ncbi:MAG: lipase family protein, partial [Methylobacteriaceae bacterium]|nr:lipase family protein [Methylobacteriaceae bacterium]
RPAITQFLDAQKPRFVHVVGHSLGGALATMAAEQIAGAGVPAKLYTFGSPRVGLARFARRVDMAVGVANIYRCYHMADPVSMLPVFPFCHVSLAMGGYRLASPGDIVAVSAHLLGGYATDAGDRSWDEIGRVRNPFGSLTAAQAWLEQAAQGAIAFPTMSGTAISLAAQALNLIIQAAVTLGVAATMLAETAADWLAQLLARIIAASIELGRMVRHFVMVCLRLVGAAVVVSAEGAGLAASFIRAVLEMLFHAIATRAARAIQLRLN